MADGIWDRAAPVYERTGVEFFAPLGRELVARAGLRPGDRVLDVGSGRGHVLFPAATAVGPGGSVTGIDLSARMVALTAAELPARGVANVTVQLGDAASPGFPPGTFDAVLAGFVMFLLPDPAAALRAYRSLLTPGGGLAFSTFGHRDERVEEARALLWSRALELASPPVDGPVDGSAGDVFGDAASIAQLVETNGFGVVTVAEVRIQTRFESFAQWWAWAWSVGLRGSLEKIPPERLPAARAEVEDVLAGFRQADGALLVTTEIRFTTAQAR